MKPFYHPTAEHLEKLSQPWSASWSRGKDSSALITWAEWLRRAAWITVERPVAVLSDTTVEDNALAAVGDRLQARLEASGWVFIIVKPEVHERLYNQILGRGLPPIHPGVRRMRWCTRSTKIDPMARRSPPGLQLTGLRLGESAMRDGKLLKAAGCAAGGECGIPEPGAGRHSPILHWKTCQVVDWLSGGVWREVRQLMRDVFEVTRQLIDVYGFTFATTLFNESEVTSAARFGCIGCPAIGAEAAAPLSVVRRNGGGSPLNELYDVWYEARLPQNRLVNVKNGHVGKPGPIRMEARKRLFDRVMDIQRRSGVVLIRPEDEAFIRQCWADQVYPRGWSAEDEEIEAPESVPLFDAG